jgi:hypothetical protein
MAMANFFIKWRVESGEVAVVVIQFTLLPANKFPTMRCPVPAILAAAFPALVLALAGCSTPQSRIEKNRAVFSGFPTAVQEKVRAGQIDVGFTPEMVALALGEPARKATRKTEAGEAEVWIYHDSSPQLSFGFGVAGGGGHTVVGGAVDVTTGGYDPEEKVRVEFRGGKVASVDYRKK